MVYIRSFVKASVLNYFRGFEGLQEVLFQDILENPSRPEQKVFVLKIKDYIWAVPFTVEEDKSIFLKTAYPSRKLFRRYGGSYEKED